MATLKRVATPQFENRCLNESNHSFDNFCTLYVFCLLTVYLHFWICYFVLFLITLLEKRKYKMVLTHILICTLKNVINDNWLILVLWAPLNDSTVNGIIGFMGSNLTRFTKSQIIILHLRYVSSSFAYWYHSVNGITLGLA